MRPRALCQQPPQTQSLIVECDEIDIGFIFPFHTALLKEKIPHFPLFPPKSSSYIPVLDCDTCIIDCVQFR